MLRLLTPLFLVTLPTILGQAALSRDQTPIPRDETREKRLRKHAEGFIDANRADFLRYRDDWTLESKGHCTPVEHPLLTEHLPGSRFYLIEMLLERKDGRGHPRNRDHVYSLAIVERQTDQIRMDTPGSLDVAKLLREARVRATTEARIREVYLLVHLLGVLDSRLVMTGIDQEGCFSPKRVLQRVLQEARMRAGISSRAPYVTPRERVRVVIGKSRKHAVLLGWAAGDWNLPLTLEYHLLSFDDAGFYVGTEKRRGKTFPADHDLESEPVREAVDEFLATLGSE